MGKRKPKLIAMGKIAADGTILRATPGITVTPTITPGNIYGPGGDIGYTVQLPAGLTRHGNYNIQLTAENYSEDGPDFVFTTIAYRNQTPTGFEVIIWADRIQTISTGPNSYTIVPVQVDWHFLIVN